MAGFYMRLGDTVGIYEVTPLAPALSYADAPPEFLNAVVLLGGSTSREDSISIISTGCDCGGAGYILIRAARRTCDNALF